MKNFKLLLVLILFAQYSVFSQCAPKVSGNSNGSRLFFKDYVDQNERDAAFDMIVSIVVNGSTYGVVKGGQTVTNIKTSPPEPDGTFANDFTGDVILNLVGGGTMVCSYVNKLLPVEFVDFNARPLGSDVNISWTTAQEFNNDKFVIERSEDGHYFEAIGEIKGSVNSNEIVHYSFLDTKAVANKYYYQIRQIDFSGDYSLSDMASVQLSSIKDVSVYPNFLETGERINVKSNEDLDFAIYSIGSQLISSGSTINTNIIETNTFESGIYFIRFSNGLSKKFVIK